MPRAKPISPKSVEAVPRRRVSFIDAMEGLMACFIIFMFGSFIVVGLMVQPSPLQKVAGLFVAFVDGFIIWMIAKRYIRGR
jgi:hypothetical protein